MNSKRLSRQLLEFIARRLCWYVWIFLYKSYRFTQHQDSQRQAASKKHSKGAYVLACWHEHLVMASMAQKGVPFKPLASRSLSGRLMAYVLNRFGFDCVYGSQNRNGKNKGGAESRMVLKELMEQGSPSAFTVDGSTGPRRYVKPGVVWLARETGAHILPVAAVADRYWEFNTWDRLKLPKPFAKIHVVYGDLIAVEPGTEKEKFEEIQELVQKGIDFCEQKAESHLLLKRTQPSETLSS